MNYERWQDITANIKDNFVVSDEGHEDLADENQREYIEFSLADKKYRLELLIKPKLLEKKTIYSNRSNAQTTEQFIFDPKEKTYVFQAFCEDENSGEWQAVSNEKFQ